MLTALYRPQHQSRTRPVPAGADAPGAAEIRIESAEVIQRFSVIGAGLDFCCAGHSVVFAEHVLLRLTEATHLVGKALGTDRLCRAGMLPTSVRRDTISYNPGFAADHAAR